MLVFAKCPSCKEHVIIKTNSSTRPELSQEKGDNFMVNCQNCGKNFSQHINEIRAKANYKFLLITILISLLVSVVFLFLFGLIGTLTITVPIAIAAQQDQSVHAFNSYRI